MPYDIHYIVVDSATGTNWPSWVAIAISILALFATLWQAHLARAHNKLSVRPQLEGHSHWEDNFYSLEVRNDGLGPAIITEARVYRHGSQVEGEGPPLIVKAFTGVPGCQLVAHEFFYTPYVLPAGQSVEICKVMCDPRILDIEGFLGGLLHLQIDYESAYKEKCPMYQTRRPPLPVTAQ
ncbi:hypothetical protein D6Z43_16170 [Pseudomonas sp. DY-1]|uniref:hypothetical protein n=1 Tax=Pseudomonas sp. DY-1 TaxID=1755504 RepID=UPI000EA9927E|nr:hypothetical protein [Pseudomonas sp. DY-1]AYF88610.1 hypothetical protein D6Z43_16170 [Pseudomonas sp. DY-1]